MKKKLVRTGKFWSRKVYRQEEGNTAPLMRKIFDAWNEIVLSYTLVCMLFVTLVYLRTFSLSPHNFELPPRFLRRSM